MSVTTTRSQAAPMVPVLQPQSFGELVQFAKMAAASTMVPRDFLGKPENIMLAVQLGSEVGLSPMQAIQNIAIVNGRPAIWGDAVIGLVRQSLVCENIIEKLEGEGELMTAVCTAKRKGMDQVVSRFSVADAKKAGLWGKQGPWQNYPARMLQMRARGFALRDCFADVLKGLKTVEEIRDYPAGKDHDERYLGTTIDAKPEPVGRTVNSTETAKAINDAIPSLDDEDSMRTRVDRLVRSLAACSSEIKFEGHQANSRSLLADIDAAGREDLKEMAVSALAAARQRFAPDQDGAEFDQASSAAG